MSRPLAALLLCAVALHADEFDSLRQRWRQTLTGGQADTSVPQIRSRLSSIESTARNHWNSIDQSAARPYLWKDLASATNSSHLTSNWRRIRDMALAWATPGQDLYANQALLTVVRGAMDWMEANRYSARVTDKYDNWWDWEIGTPLQLGDVLVLLYDQLTPAEIGKQAAAMERFVGDPRIMVRSTVSTGANRVWKCKGAILRAIAVRDEDRLKLASEALNPVFAYVTSGDGFYDDGSFIQHGRHPYTGGYGNALIGELSEVLYLLAGSTWDVTDPARANVWRWIFDSFEPLLYRGAMMDMVRGREVSRSGSPDHGTGHSIAAAILRFSSFAPAEHASRIRAMLREWYLSDTSRDWAASRSIHQIMAIRELLAGDERRGELTGSWVFPGMDRVVHLRPGWGLGIAMNSARIYNYESINKENLRGWHTSDGATYLYNHELAQFSDNFWPTIDPQRIPGTTVVSGSTPRQSQVGGSNIAGGATLHGFTAAMMRISSDELEANKSWFLFDNEIAALGSGIRSTRAGKTIETIVENRLVSKDHEFTRADDGAWAHLAGSEIGYYFPAERNWRSLRENRTGSWSLINSGGSTAKVTRSYQTLWFDHGAEPQDGSYAYVLLPAFSAGQTAAYPESPRVQVLENSASAHAVKQAMPNLRAVNFWQTSPHTAAGVTSDGIASVLVLESDGTLEIAVSDPTQANSSGLRVELDDHAGEILEKDEAVQVEQLAPKVILKIDTRNARGRTLRLKLRL